MKEPISIPSGEWQDLGIQNIGPIKKFMGVSTLDPFSLPIGFATSTKNLSGAGGTFPSIATRPNFAEMGTGMGTVVGLGLHLNSELIAAASGSWYKWNGSSWVSVTSGLSTDTTKPWSFTNFKGNLATTNLIGVNGVDTPRKYDGTSVTTLTGTPAGVTFKLIDQHDSRLYATDGKSIYHSGVGQPQNWAATATTPDSGGGIITIETNTGEEINAIKAGAKHLMVFKRNMFGELWGTRPSNFQFQVLGETGALGPNAVTVKDDTTYWASDSGAFRYNGGLPRKDFSLPVSGYFAQMNKAQAHKACAVSTSDSVLFSIPTGVSTTNDTTLEYLPDFQMWSVWKDFAPTQWAYWNNKLVYGDANSVFQTAGNGNNVAWEWISPPFGSGSFSTRHQWYKIWYVIDIPLGTSLTVSVSRKAEGNLLPDWLTAYNVPSNAIFVDDGYNGFGRPLAGRRIIIPISQVANSNWLRVKFSGTGPVKFHELNIQQREMPLR